MAEEKKKSSGEQPKCPGCGRRLKGARSLYCPGCGLERYTPVINKKFNFKIVLWIIVASVLIYLAYLILKRPLYYWLDKVPHR